MNRRPFSARLLVAFATVVVGLVAVASVPMGATVTPCQALKTWAAPFSDTSPSLAALQRYDRAHRAAIFSAVAPATKAALWREQLGALALRSDLTQQQRELAREGVAVITPALYQGDAAAKAQIDALWSRVQQTYEPQSIRAWTDIGFSGKATPRAAREATCNCTGATATYDCPFSGVCFSGGCTLLQACGHVGTGICNGLCG